MWCYENIINRWPLVKMEMLWKGQHWEGLGRQVLGCWLLMASCIQPHQDPQQSSHLSAG